MTLQELCDCYDAHPELQEEILANPLVWWAKEKQPFYRRMNILGYNS